MKLLDLVALLAEGVDRNFWFFSALFKASKVALLAEGVDRNLPQVKIVVLLHVSPSSRRAWIEIPARRQLSAFRPVALLAEGVDRNIAFVPASYKKFASPSSRRAWIEIFGGVDCAKNRSGRPPRGGRG